MQPMLLLTLRHVEMTSDFVLTVVPCVVMVCGRNFTVAVWTGSQDDMACKICLVIVHLEW
jgi:hypothetical protein